MLRAKNLEINQSNMSFIIRAFIASFLIIIGIIGLSINYINRYNFIHSSEPCDAIVTKVVRDRRAKTSYKYKAHIKYTVNGITYTDKIIKNVPAFTRKGEKITIYYNPNNPSEINTEPSNQSQVLNYTLFIALFVGGGIFLYSTILKFNKERVFETAKKQMIEANKEAPIAYYIDETLDYEDIQQPKNKSPFEKYSK